MMGCLGCYYHRIFCEEIKMMRENELFVLWMIIRLGLLSLTHNMQHFSLALHFA